LSAFVDTNILVRHLTGAPPDMASRATAYLRDESELILADLVVAETVYVLQSVYDASQAQVAEAVRSLLALPSVVTINSALLLRTVEIYETDRLDFAEAYLVACAETTGIGRVASFDRSINRVGTVERVEPS
jgi:predicted nucleic acid-binding protein